ncbi:MAG: hypothetical protein ABRQ38_02910 [Candidatus Eremiobacterota bacterium]
MLKPFILLFILLISLFIINSCGGGSSTSGTVVIPTSVPTEGPTATPTNSPIGGNVPVPNGYTSVPANISNGTLELSVNNFSSSNEGYLLLTYHSDTPADTANPIAINATFNNGTSGKENTESSVPVSSVKKTSLAPAMSDKYRKYYKNHLDKLRHDFELVQELSRQGKYPRSLSNDELKSRGRLGKDGMVASAQVGDTRNFWIYFPSPYGYMDRPCQCYAVGEHCYVFMDTDDPPLYFNDATTYAQQLASYFDSQIYSTVHERVGYEWSPGIDGDTRIFIILSANFNNAYYPFSDPYPQSSLPSGEYSNEVEAIYIDPLVFADTDSMGNPEAAENTLAQIQAVAGHEYTHMVRFNMKYIASNKGTPIDYTTMGNYFSSEICIHEGCAQYTENVLLRRGITDNYAKVNALRSSGLEPYLRAPELSSLTSGTFNSNSNDGLGTYEMGFFNVEYLYEKLGSDSIKRLNQADGKICLDSLYAAAGNRNTFENLFDMHALALALSGKVSDNNYTFTGIDLTGNTSYGGTSLHNAWSAFGNTGIEGINVSQANNNSFSGYLYEWSPWFMRCYTGNGGTLSIKVTGLNVGQGGGNIKAYFVYR